MLDPNGPSPDPVERIPAASGSWSQFRPETCQDRGRSFSLDQDYFRVVGTLTKFEKNLRFLAGFRRSGRYYFRVELAVSTVVGTFSGSRT